MNLIYFTFTKSALMYKISKRVHLSSMIKYRFNFNMDFANKSEINKNLEKKFIV